MPAEIDVEPHLEHEDVHGEGITIAVSWWRQTGTTHVADELAITTSRGTLHLKNADDEDGEVLPLLEQIYTVSPHRWLVLGWSSYGEGMQTEHAWLIDDTSKPLVVDKLGWTTDERTPPTSYLPLMAKLVFGMSQSLDGYVDDAAGTLCMPPPSPAVFRHFIDVVAGHSGCIYGRRIYEVMRYWDVERPEWGVAEREFAAAWQRQPKWVASRTLASVGPNATLIRGDLEAFVRDLKATVDGELDVAGPELAAAIAPLIDEYRLYFRPYVLGGGKPYFAGARPPLRFVGTDRIGEDVVRLTYVPA